jgi:flagellar hook-length control protein FliK
LQPHLTFTENAMFNIDAALSRSSLPVVAAAQPPARSGGSFSKIMADTRNAEPPAPAPSAQAATSPAGAEPAEAQRANAAARNQARLAGRAATRSAEAAAKAPTKAPNKAPATPPTSDPVTPDAEPAEKASAELEAQRAPDAATANMAGTPAAPIAPDLAVWAALLTHTMPVDAEIEVSPNPGGATQPGGIELGPRDLARTPGRPHAKALPLTDAPDSLDRHQAMARADVSAHVNDTLPGNFGLAADAAVAALQNGQAVAIQRSAGAAPSGDVSALAGSAAALAAPAGSTLLPETLTVQVGTAVHSPEFREALGVQVSVLARDGVQSAELHLNPAEMGPISVHIVMDGAQARVDFGADLASTRELIESGLPELAAALRDAGFTLAGGGVSQHSQSSQGRSQNPPDTRSNAGAGSGAARHSIDAPAEHAAPVSLRLRVPNSAVDIYA